MGRRERAPSRWMSHSSKFGRFTMDISGICVRSLIPQCWLAHSRRPDDRSFGRRVGGRNGMNAPETRYVAVGEAEVAYQVIGEGPLDLVYHHGFCQLDLQWDVAPEAAFNRRLAGFSRL